MRRMSISKFARMRLGAATARSTSSNLFAPAAAASVSTFPKVTSFTARHVAPLASLQTRFQSSQSSFAEPEQTLFHGATGTTVTNDVTDPDKQLRADVRTMGSILGKFPFGLE
jgi:hypothetical protein